MRWALASLLAVQVLVVAVGWAKTPAGVVTEVQGQAQIRRAGQSSWLPVRVNMSVYPGDTVRTGKKGKVVLWRPIGRAEVIGPNKTVMVSPAQNNVRDSVWRDLWQSVVSRMRKNFSEESLATVAAARMLPPQPNTLTLLSPRNSRVLELRPTFFWREVDGAQGYRVIIGFFDQERRVWETTVTKPPFRYPVEAPELKPGKTYIWQVEAIGVPNASDSAWFVVAHPGEANDVRFTLQQLRKATPDTLAYSLMAASLLEAKGFYWEAIHLLQAVTKQHPRQPEPFIVLANLYDTVGLERFAAEMRVRAQSGLKSVRSLGWQVAATR